MLFPATSTNDRITFHTLSRKTHNRLRQQMFDPETGEVVPKQDQVKGYEFQKGNYVLVEDEEIASVKIESTETIDIERFARREDIDPLYWDEPYFMAPADKFAQEAFAVIREALKHENVVALGRVVISNRERPVAIEPRDKGMIVTRLRAASEVRNPNLSFADIPDVKLDPELVSTAEQIIDRKRGPFDPAMFSDRYQVALKKLVDGKLNGETPVEPKVNEPAKVINLFEALKKSLDESAPTPAKKAAPGSRHTKEPKRKRA
jgi:DNA end-binding protein Ku